MKRATILLVALALLLTAAAPVAAKGDHERPFKGTAQGYGMVQEDLSCPPVDLRSVFTTTGRATHMGKLQLDFYNCTPPGSTVTGIEMTFVAANGDKVFADYAAAGLPPVGPDPMLLEITYEFEITGGTGRFEGASGGGLIMADIEWPGFETNYWPTELTIKGAIAY